MIARVRPVFECLQVRQGPRNSRPGERRVRRARSGASLGVATTANGLNRNATVGGVAQTYDRFGNLTSDGTRTFAYDTENRLLTETGPISVALSYDPMGRLQQSVINGTTTQFLYDGDALVGEYPATGNTPLRRYVDGVEGPPESPPGSR